MRFRVCLVALIGMAATAQQPVVYNRDIRPILSDRCYTCHGPDSARRTSKLRLDVETSARGAGSELVKRISSDDTARRMPPAWSGAAKLSDREIGLLTQWVE